MKAYRKIWKWIALILVIVLVGCYFIRVPYFIQTPGKAQSMNGMIQVRGGQKIHGNFSLVYIYLGPANVYEYLWAKYDGNKYTTLIRQNEVMLPGQNDHDYNQIQEGYMKNAQQSAAYVASRAAGKKARILNEGVLVLDVMPQMPSRKVLRSGDIITGIANHRIRSTLDLQKQIIGRKVGDRLNLTILRGKQIRHVAVQVARFPKSAADSGVRQGIGIYQDDYLRISTSPAVSFDIHNIGGPSAGLMMTLDIYDQMNHQDLAGGRAIAGTGTINLDGSVGPIGGIEEKIVGADHSGIAIFFAPVADHEYQDAQKTARAIHSHMKIVPVRTFNDAVNYLKNHRH